MNMDAPFCQRANMPAEFSLHIHNPVAANPDRVLFYWLK